MSALEKSKEGKIRSDRSTNYFHGCGLMKSTGTPRTEAQRNLRLQTHLFGFSRCTDGGSGEALRLQRRGKEKPAPLQSPSNPPANVKLECKNKQNKSLQNIRKHKWTPLSAAYLHKQDVFGRRTSQIWKDLICRWIPQTFRAVGETISSPLFLQGHFCNAAAWLLINTIKNTSHSIYWPNKPSVATHRWVSPVFVSVMGL